MSLLHVHVCAGLQTLLALQETALFKLSSLQQQLCDSVPVEEMDKANRQYNQLATKYQQLLSQQTSYTANAASVQRLQVSEL